MNPICSFSKPENPSSLNPTECPYKPQNSKFETPNFGNPKPSIISPKCPFGYDTQTFKIGPLSCLVCQALLYESTRCLPCNHVYCKACILRFSDCPLCGADIQQVEADSKFQSTVDLFIEGHARINRSHIDGESGKSIDGEPGKSIDDVKKTVIYEDVSLERGAFLVQQAMRAFRAKNVESAKSRLSLCALDIRVQLEKMGNTSELCSQLGAVLGMLGDCCRALGETGSAVDYFEESVTFLSNLPDNDREITHTLSVSLNKIGDLKYYDGDLHAARSCYYRSLNVRRDAAKHHPNVSSQTLDVAVSLAKVADVDRSLGDEDLAIDGFHEATKLLESLTLNSDEASLEKQRLTVLDFLKQQIEDKQAVPKN